MFTFFTVRFRTAGPSDPVRRDAARSMAVVSAPAAVDVALALAASRVAVVSAPDAEDVAVTAVGNGVDAESDPVAADVLNAPTQRWRAGRA